MVDRCCQIANLPQYRGPRMLRLLTHRETRHGLRRIWLAAKHFRVARAFGDGGNRENVDSHEARFEKSVHGSALLKVLIHIGESGVCRRETMRMNFSVVTSRF